MNIKSIQNQYLFNLATIKIAELLGLTFIPSCDDAKGNATPELWKHTDENDEETFLDETELPAFLNDQEKTIFAQGMQALMSGVEKVTHEKGNCVLFYSDATKEVCAMTFEKWVELYESKNFFSFVSFVQSNRA